MTAREKLIELLRKAKSSMWGQSGLSCELARNSYIAEYLIANGVTFASDTNVGSKWIPVTERLPEAGEIVLCHMKYGEMYVLQRDSHAYYGWVGDRISYATSCVTHWIPMPEPPKGD